MQKATSRSDVQKVAGWTGKVDFWSRSGSENHKFYIGIPSIS